MSKNYTYKLDDFEHPFDALTEFEAKLSEFTGAPYVVLTDCCTHAIELCLRLQRSYDNYPFDHVTLPHQTYLSVPMLMRKLGIPFNYDPHLDWEQDLEYRIAPTNIWDSARKFKKDMFKPGQIQCLSFGNGKPLQIQGGGAILLDDANEACLLRRMAYDGRDLLFERTVGENWHNTKEFMVGYHYMMRVEQAITGLNLLGQGRINPPMNHTFPDLREIEIV